MGLIVFSTMLAIVLGSCAWLLLGDRFPIGGGAKWPTLHNICIYAGILLVPIYLTVFFLF